MAVTGYPCEIERGFARMVMPIICDRVLIVPSRWRHCYNDDTVFFNYFTFIYSFVLLGHELYYIILLLVSYCIFPVQ